MTNRQLRNFLVIAFTLAFAGQVVVGYLGGEGWSRTLLMLVMWTPGIAAIFGGPESRRRIVASLKTGGARLILPALMLGWSFTLLQTLMLEAVASAEWNNALFPVADAGISSKIHMVLGNAPRSAGFFGLNWTLTLLLGSVFSVLPALGEELGWRSTLQPELDRRMNPLASTIFVGLLWGYWHLPVNLFGLNDPVHPIINALIVFPCISVLLAFPFAWLWRNTRSIWPPAICHGAGDAILGGPLVLPTSWTADTVSMLAVTFLVALPFVAATYKSQRCDLPMPKI